MDVSTRGMRGSVLALGVLAALVAGNAEASGFQLRENSVKASGRAAAGAASAKGDAAVVANNPALMTTFKEKTAQVDGSLINLSFKFDGNTCAAGSAYDPATHTCDKYIPGNDNKGGNAGGLNAVPAMAMVFPLHDNLEGFALGASVSAPFGLKTDYDPNWTGRYFGTLSDVKVVDATFSAAANVGDHFSIGVGAIVEYMKVTLGERIDFANGTCNQIAQLPPALLTNLLNTLGLGTTVNNLTCSVALTALGNPGDGAVQITGDDIAFGWNAGIDWRPTDNFSLGLDYRPGIRHSLRGKGDFTVPQQLTALLALTQPGMYVDGGGGAEFTVPKVATASMTWQATHNLALMAEYQRTGWSSLQQIRINFDPNAQNPAGMSQVEDYDWHDTNYYAFGAEYRIADNFTVRGGVGFDQSPIKDDYRTRALDYGNQQQVTDMYRTPRLPDENRRIYALGMSWVPGENWEFSLDYERVQIAKTPQVDLVSGESGQGARLVGDYAGSADVYGMSAQFNF